MPPDEHLIEMPANALDDGIMSSLLKRYEQLKSVDAHKTSLIDDIVTRFQYISERLVKERADFNRERKWAEENLHMSQRNTQQLQALLDADPFVLVLIDGADLIFRNTFLCDGDNGGRRCAAMFNQTINEYVFSSIDDLPPETKVIVRVYADLEELALLCLHNNIVDQGAKIRGFARGFVQDKTLFDIVNVYSQGKESIIDKVEAQLKQHLYDFHCRQIIVGCSDDGIYPRILENIAKDELAHTRVTLLSGIPLHKDFEKLPYSTTRMTDIFRNTSIETYKVKDFIPELEPMPTYFLPSPIGTPFGVMTPPLSTPSLSIRSDSRLEKTRPRTSSVSSSANSSERAATTATASKPLTWASLVKKSKAAPVTMSEALLRKEAPMPTIRRNKHGQRLDPPPPEYKKDEVNRLKKMKLCNAHYLRSDCIYEDTKCTHEHLYKCTKSEIETLKLVARMSCCIHGSECSDEKCIYGHNCPFPEAKEGSMRGKGCLNGENCRFPSHMHGMNMVPVRYTKIT